MIESSINSVVLYKGQSSIKRQSEDDIFQQQYRLYTIKTLDSPLRNTYNNTDTDCEDALSTTTDWVC